MTKKRKAPAPPATDDAAKDAVTPPAPPATDDAGDAHEAEVEQLPEVETVRALVLYDSVYGKCGEVKPFRADQVEDIADAGFIDAHPNAVASAGG